MEDWGSYFDQAPTTMAQLPVAAMRYAARQGSPGPFGGKGVFPASAGRMPTTLVQSQAQQPKVDLSAGLPLQPPKIAQQGNELENDVKGVSGLVDAISGKSNQQKPDKFHDAMATIDQQLAEMRAQREQMMASVGGAGAQASAPGGPLYSVGKVQMPNPGFGSGPGSDAAGPEGFGYNVGNLRASGVNWAGKGTPHNGFETFNTPEAGAAAMYNNLKSYAQDPNMTLGSAIMKWAPPSENNTEAYIANVAKMAGMDAKTPLSQIVASPEMAAKMMMAMGKIEKGKMHPAFTPELFQKVAGGDTGDKKVAANENKYAAGGRVRYLRSLVG